MLYADIDQPYDRLLRHMLNWEVRYEYLEKTPFRSGTETLIKKLHEDNQRRRLWRTRNSGGWQRHGLPAIDDHHRARHWVTPR